MEELLERLQAFAGLDRAYLKPDSLLCEFVGGGIYEV